MLQLTKPAQRLLVRLIVALPAERIVGIAMLEVQLAAGPNNTVFRQVHMYTIGPRDQSHISPCVFWENWHLTRILIVFLLAAATLRPAKVPSSEFPVRRAELRKSLDGVFLLRGQSELHDQYFRFAQNSNFYYLTGWTEPGAV